VDWTDHVWTEVYSHQLGRWVHCDACENAWDKALLYEQGWGKKLSYCVAFSVCGVKDVSMRYTSNWEEMKTRRSAVPETWLARTCQFMTNKVRASMPQQQRTALVVRDLAETLQLAALSAGVQGSRQENLPGRQSGSEAWRLSRGEMGAGTSQGQAGKQVAGWTTGGYRGVVTVSGEHYLGSEEAINLFDGKPGTKWLDFGAGEGKPSWVEFRFWDAIPKSAFEYSLTSGNDSPERDPKNFILEGQLRGSGDWVVLDTRQGVYFGERNQERKFVVAKSLACVAYRLTIRELRDPANANSVQLTGFGLAFVEGNPSSSPYSLQILS